MAFPPSRRYAAAPVEAVLPLRHNDTPSPYTKAVPIFRQVAAIVEAQVYLITATEVTTGTAGQYSARRRGDLRARPVRVTPTSRAGGTHLSLRKAWLPALAVRKCLIRAPVGSYHAPNFA